MKGDQLYAGLSADQEYRAWRIRRAKLRFRADCGQVNQLSFN